jgi:hypothetical protein
MDINVPKAQLYTRDDVRCGKPLAKRSPEICLTRHSSEFSWWYSTVLTGYIVLEIRHVTLNCFFRSTYHLFSAAPSPLRQHSSTTHPRCCSHVQYGCAIRIQYVMSRLLSKRQPNRILPDQPIELVPSSNKYCTY